MQSILNRNIIHEDFKLYPERISRDKFFTKIDRAKNYLSNTFSKGDHIAISHFQNNSNTLAFTFACFELGLVINIMSPIFYCGHEHKPEQFKKLHELFEQRSRNSNRWFIEGMVNDRDDAIGNFTKRDIFGSSYQAWIESNGFPNLYMKNCETCSDNKIDVNIKEYDDATAKFSDDLTKTYQSHQDVLNTALSSPVDFRGKVVALTNNMHHNNALERLILPALIQSGKVVDIGFPEPDFGGFFITNDKITKEELFHDIYMKTFRMIDIFKVDIVMAPEDSTLFHVFEKYKHIDFPKLLEIIIHGPVTEKHLEWEKRMNIKFIGTY